MTNFRSPASLALATGAAFLLATCGQLPVSNGPPLQQPPAQPVNSDLAAADLGGGCHPAPLNVTLAAQFSDVNPSWVPVINGSSPDTVPVILSGPVLDAHGDTGGDFPENHLSSDVIADIQLSDSEKGYAATGNDTEGVIHLEWESASLQSFAWPAAGDFVTAMGRWIFDCGHPGSQPGQCSTHSTQRCITDEDCTPPLCPGCLQTETCQGAHFHYSSELHPPYAIAVSRLGRGGIVTDDANATPTLATRTDIFVSPNGGGAADRCVLTHVADDGTFLLQTNCYPLSQPITPLYFNNWDFEFDIPLPTRPAGAELSWHIDNRETPGGVPAVVVFEPHADASPPTLHGSVRLSQRVNGQLATGYAATVFAGWKMPPPQPLTHIRVTIQSVTIHNPLRPATPIVRPVKDWVLEGAVNGIAQRFTGLDAPNLGDVIQQGLVYDEFLPPDGMLHVFVEGTVHTCIDSLFGQSFGTDIGQLGLSNLQPCLLSEDPDPGDVDVTYAGPDFGSGGSMTAYDTASVHGQGGFCSVTQATPCLSAADCPSGEDCTPKDGPYSIQYTVQQVP